MSILFNVTRLLVNAKRLARPSILFGTGASFAKRSEYRMFPEVLEEISW